MREVSCARYDDDFGADETGSFALVFERCDGVFGASYHEYIEMLERFAVPADTGAVDLAVEPAVPADTADVVEIVIVMLVDSASELLVASGRDDRRADTRELATGCEPFADDRQAMACYIVCLADENSCSAQVRDTYW